MILAADIGATKTYIGLYNRGTSRPIAVESRNYPTGAFDGLPSIIKEYFKDRGGPPPRIDVATFGVAGPVIGGSAELTNVAWSIDARAVGKELGVERVFLINDLEAMAYSIPYLMTDELITLQEGEARDDGNGAIIAAGTGLGEAILHRVGQKLRPVPSEGGHADFAARTDREIDLLKFLRGTNGRVDVEQVISGPGLMNVFRFCHQGSACEALGPLEDAPDAPSLVSRSGMENWCPRCVDAMQVFVDAYGSQAGNLALRGLATAGVYIGGGIAPKIMPALKKGRFLQAFASKPPMEALLKRLPIYVINNPQSALLGAAAYGNEMA